ncbi:MAG: thiamine-phosphate kinase [Hydrogenovibrio sp.]|uniref:thiamine-phosphate kinase n=1 Tax=Hydrogenovibrio sp. TaxID=2065821 RepID=UPI00286FC621|nr:thiamine-phosphate kinase [Hydrogenovibrio sp.]MDR9499989.1 thiamine-phosphate kinase [Hydrogenovibrio sp.]
MPAEFDLIERYFQPLSHIGTTPLVGIGDDGAVLASEPGQDWVVVTDTLIEGVHFPVDTRPEAIAWKALAVNLSDLAAMGATPVAFSLALTLPDNKNHQAWLARFALGLTRLARRFQIPLIGGDTTRHHTLVLTVTAHGQVPAGQALRRSGAAVDDLLAVTGVIGDGGLGLASKSGQLPGRRAMSAELKLNRPMPRVSFGSRILGLASAAIDVSDGFLADLMHLTQASRLGAEIQCESLPFSKAVKARFDGTDIDWLTPLTAGDDYELIVAFPAQKLAAMQQASVATQTPFQVIGKLVAGEQVVLNKDEKEWKRFGPTDVSAGYQHFH